MRGQKKEDRGQVRRKDAEKTTYTREVGKESGSGVSEMGGWVNGQRFGSGRGEAPAALPHSERRSPGSRCFRGTLRCNAFIIGDFE